MIVRSAVYEVCWSGAYPGQRKVNAKLPPKMWGDPIAWDERRAVMRELGLDALLRGTKSTTILQNL
jgi:hypothetical protein